MNADDEIGAAVERAKDFIMDETIAVSVESKEDLPAFDINGHKTGLAVEKVQ
jgi:isoleucyl-tRNA synthetase